MGKGHERTSPAMGVVGESGGEVMTQAVMVGVGIARQVVVTHFGIIFKLLSYVKNTSGNL